MSLSTTPTVAYFVRLIRIVICNLVLRIHFYPLLGNRVKETGLDNLLPWHVGTN